MNVNGNQIIDLGFPKGKVIGIVLQTIRQHFSDCNFEEIEHNLKQVLANPIEFLNHNTFGAIAEELLKPEEIILSLNDSSKKYKVYGEEGIEQGAKDQMNMAMRLPVAFAGALMPDAHQGYGLPIGGVLATKNAVIPYGVGVDIGCRMCMTIYDIPGTTLIEKKSPLKDLLLQNTRFGRAVFEQPKDHEILENHLFNEIEFIGNLKDKAAAQIGTSGGGNHFVEFGIVNIEDENNEFKLPVGKYVALLSHSGSRGFGGQIANHYTKLAKDICKLPKEAQHLAWLDLDTEAGQEYWMAMNLAGEYASACHHQIHERIGNMLKSTPLARIENHHNFAWKEKDVEGNEIIVHRKGATPATKGVLGIIPGSMTAPGYIVRGKGEWGSINSASHGAGRAMSRTQAKNTLDKNLVLKHIHGAGVEVIGSGLDEAPMAYKDIKQVMKSQEELVDIVGTFQPKIVRMCGDEKFQESN